MKHLLILISILLPVSVFPQNNVPAPIYKQSIAATPIEIQISKIFHSIILSIAGKLIQEVQNGNLKAYKSDLESVYTAEEIQELFTDSFFYPILGIQVYFEKDIDLLSNSGNFTLTAIAPIWQPVIGNITIPVLTFWIKSTDYANLLSEEDIQVINLFTNLNFSNLNNEDIIRLETMEKYKHSPSHQVLITENFSNTLSYMFIDFLMYFLEVDANKNGVSLLYKNSYSQNRMTIDELDIMLTYEEEHEWKILKAFFDFKHFNLTSIENNSIIVAYYHAQIPYYFYLKTDELQKIVPDWYKLLLKLVMEGMGE